MLTVYKVLKALGEQGSLKEQYECNVTGVHMYVCMYVCMYDPLPP